MRFPRRAFNCWFIFHFSIVAPLFVSFATWAPVRSQVCSGCEVSGQTITRANQRLTLGDSERADTESHHLLGGRPMPASDATDEHTFYQLESLGYAELFRRFNERSASERPIIETVSTGTGAERPNEIS